MSEDVLAALDSIKKLGIKFRIHKNYCEIFGNGINGFKYKKNLTINARNSGTLGRLLLGLLIFIPCSSFDENDIASFKFIERSIV
jgi:3-phosphoshikimate 1-carboxyvinyltransferase